MSADPRIADLLAAQERYAAERRRMDEAERARARAVIAARAGGMTTREVAAVLGVVQPRVIALTRWGVDQGLAPDGWTPPGAPAQLDRSATRRGAPEPTPLGVVLAELVAACPPAAELDQSATSECDEFGCHEPCRRLGCRERAAPGQAYCAEHARY